MWPCAWQMVGTVADDGPRVEDGDHTVPLSVSPQHQDAGTQWEDRAPMDHRTEEEGHTRTEEEALL